MEKSKRKWEWHTILIPVGISILISLGAYVYGLGTTEGRIKHLEEEVIELKTEIKDEKAGILEIEKKADRIEVILDKQDEILKIIFEKIVKQDPKIALKQYEKTN